MLAAIFRPSPLGRAKSIILARWEDKLQTKHNSQERQTRNEQVKLKEAFS